MVEDLRHELEHLLHEASVLHCPLKLEAVDKGVKHGLVEPDLLALLLTNGASESGARSNSLSHSLLGEETIKVDDDLLASAVEYGILSHRQVQVQGEASEAL